MTHAFVEICQRRFLILLCNGGWSCWWWWWIKDQWWALQCLSTFSYSPSNIALKRRLLSKRRISSHTSKHTHTRSKKCMGYTMMNFILHHIPWSNCSCWSRGWCWWLATDRRRCRWCCWWWRRWWGCMCWKDVCSCCCCGRFHVDWRRWRVTVDGAIHRRGTLMLRKSRVIALEKIEVVIDAVLCTG